MGVMKMSAARLRELADKVDGLASVKGIDLTGFAFGQHDIYVERSSDQRDGGTYFVVAIEHQDGQ